jgi:hypothetical protein
MATMTAQILIGSPHPYHGGIIPSHKIYLSENSRPALIMAKENIGEDSYEQNTKNAFDKVTWIPTLENMLDDILLMVSFFILKDKYISEELLKIDNKKLSFLELYEDIDEKTRFDLYQSNKKVIGGYKDLKFIFSIFKGSALIAETNKIKDYKIDYELCVSK